MKYSSVIVTGSVAYDEIMVFPGKFIDYFQPEKLHQINVSFVVDKLEKQLGGTGLNITYNIKHLTVNKKIVLLASVGKDSQPIMDFCGKNKIATGGILIDKELFTATGKVITDLKDNQIWGYYYGASANAGQLDLKKYADKNSLVIISANHPEGFLHFQSQAIESGLDYFYDPGMSLTWIKKEDLYEGVMNCKWLAGNDYEMGRIIKILEISYSLLEKKGINVITTLGEQGVEYYGKVGANLNSPIQKIKISAYKTKVVDPTGAGDAWRGGFIAGIIDGKSIVESLKLGNVMASFAIEKYGTVNHQPTLAQINKRLSKLKIKNFKLL